MPLTPDLDHAYLLSLLSYNPANGRLTWRVNRGGRAKRGDEAGTVRKDGTVGVGVDGTVYMANRLVWFMVHGEWPKKRLTFKNGDKNDLRLANIIEESGRYAMTQTARYQRRRRHEQAGITRYIQRNEARLARYYDTMTDPEKHKRFLAEMRDAYRSERDQLGFDRYDV